MEAFMMRALRTLEVYTVNLGLVEEFLAAN